MWINIWKNHCDTWYIQIFATRGFWWYFDIRILGTCTDWALCTGTWSARTFCWQTTTTCELQTSGSPDSWVAVGTRVWTRCAVRWRTRHRNSWLVRDRTIRWPRMCGPWAWCCSWWRTMWHHSGTRRKKIWLRSRWIPSYYIKFYI